MVSTGLRDRLPLVSLLDVLCDVCEAYGLAMHAGMELGTLRFTAGNACLRRRKIVIKRWSQLLYKYKSMILEE